MTNSIRETPESEAGQDAGKIADQLNATDIYINNLWSTATTLRDNHTGQAHADLNSLKHALGAVPDVLIPAAQLIRAQAAKIAELREALKPFAEAPEDWLARDLAITLVDWRRGYTMEFAGGPGAQAAHREEYDQWEEAIKSALRVNGFSLVRAAILKAEGGEQ